MPSSCSTSDSATLSNKPDINQKSADKPNHEKTTHRLDDELTNRALLGAIDAAIDFAAKL
jgi:hypothetical protein